MTDVATQRQNIARHKGEEFALSHRPESFWNSSVDVGVFEYKFGEPAANISQVKSSAFDKVYNNVHISKKEQRDDGIWEMKTGPKGYYDHYVLCTNYPLPPVHLQPNVYFEVHFKYFMSKVLCRASVGLVTHPYPSFRMPGWHPNSIGYHDGGFVTISDPDNRHDSQSYGEGDIVGVLLLRTTNGLHAQVQFSRNGVLLPQKWEVPVSDYFPAIGCNSYLTLGINFGELPFRCAAIDHRQYGLQAYRHPQYVDESKRPADSGPRYVPPVSQHVPVAPQYGSSEAVPKPPAYDNPPVYNQNPPGYSNNPPSYSHNPQQGHNDPYATHTHLPSYDSPPPAYHHTPSDYAYPSPAPPASVPMYQGNPVIHHPPANNPTSNQQPPVAKPQAAGNAEQDPNCVVM
eukprot:TRINITY_DN8936_c0_g1_i5.p1 TRINITY_DN8936_c0_g1~~TRINITY_DN8936_c0_g1_i5.p1  ORF type:complete len:400 (-),score=64.23 TRINITY_DN8936_c0_g1_i5:182-1381(-)